MTAYHTSNERAVLSLCLLCEIYQISLHGIKANTFTICTPLSWPYKGKKMFCLVQHSVGALSYKFERNILKNQY